MSNSFAEENVTVFDHNDKRLGYFHDSEISVSKDLTGLAEFENLVEVTGNPDALDAILHRSPAGARILLLGLPYAHRQYTFENIVAYDKMLGRGIPSDHDMVGKSIPESRAGRPMAVPAITMEGFRESDLTIAPNGDLICVMRSGGRNPKMGVNLFPTPLYCARSSDNGKTWTLPEQIADRGVCPYLVTMSNGIIVCTYSRPGNWLIFSGDNGKTWKGAFQFGSGGATNFIVETEPNTVQVFYEVGENDREELWGTFFEVSKMNSSDLE